MSINDHSRLFLAAFTATCFSITLAGCSAQPSAATDHENRILIRGVYGTPQPLWDKGHSLPALGVNAVFMHHQSITPAIMQRAASEGIPVYAEFATLNGKGYVEKHPEAWAIDEQGKRVEQATWFMGVCPTEPGFRGYRKQELRRLLNTHNIAGVWMDYLHWHAQFEDPAPILPETCFCSSCLKTFEKFAALQIPEGDAKTRASWILENQETTWRNWRTSVIADWIRDFRKIINEEKPGILLGIYHCPWNDDEYGGARRSILGLDYDSLKNLADVFSPMVYHGRMVREAEWVKDNIEWFSKRLPSGKNGRPMIWPIVQAYDEPRPIGPEEFEAVLRFGAAGRSTGVMMFTTNAVAGNPEKTETLRSVYTEWKNEKAGRK